MHAPPSHPTRRRLALASPAVALLAIGCATWPLSHRPEPVQPPAPEPARPLPYPIVESHAFARAVEKGTRTRTGEPGPAYWQQFARYRIDAELVPATSRVNGRETVRYLNRSPDTLKTLWIFLNQNLFAPGSPRTITVPITGGMEILRMAVAGQTLARRGRGGGGGSAAGTGASVTLAGAGGSGGADGSAGATGAYTIDGTLMRVDLPAALVPRDSVDLDIAWTFQIPPDGAPREGTTGDVFMIAYWYPQMAVYDDVSGWVIDPYLGTGEFYMGYADYDVNISLPQGWLVGATGELVNDAQVLSAQTRGRLAEARRAAGLRVVHVVQPQDRGAGPSRATATGFDGVLTWRFRARNVRDFDWGASARFVWDATMAVAGDVDGDGRADSTAIYTLYRPEARAWAWDRSAEYERHAVEFLSTYLWPYPWPQMTALEGPASCSGMEYPMLTCIGGPRDTLSLYSVQIHETAHMWFPMQVGSDERRYAWQDEGLTRFNQAQGMQAYFTGYDREVLSREAYLAFARTDGETPLMRPADAYPPGTPAYTVATYEKMATNMVALRALLGDDTFLSSYRTYGMRWRFRHPTQYDFFNTFATLAGRDLSWFWRTWWYETWTLDQAIGGVASLETTLLVTIDDRGLAMMPVHLAVTRSDGRVERITVPDSVWRSGTRHHTVHIEQGATVTALEIDPEHVFPDIDRSNNRWVRR